MRFDSEDLRADQQLVPGPAEALQKHMEHMELKDVATTGRRCRVTAPLISILAGLGLVGCILPELPDMRSSDVVESAGQSADDGGATVTTAGTVPPAFSASAHGGSEALPGPSSSDQADAGMSPGVSGKETNAVPEHPAPCVPNPCLNDGSCLPSGNTFSCDCSGTGFDGTRCEEADPGLCDAAGNDCHPLARCQSHGRELVCVCPATHVGTGVGPDGCRQRVKEINVSAVDVCALTESGQVYCWGQDLLTPNVDAQGTAPSTPRRIEGLDEVVSLGRGHGYHACVVLRAGTAQCWGANDAGQLGDGSTAPVSSPVEVLALGNVKQIAYSIVGTTCAINGGEVSCWGAQTQHDASNSQPGLFPMPVGGVTDVTRVSMGLHTCILLSDGTASCWGQNVEGELGSTTAPDNEAYAPQPVTVATGIKEIVAFGAVSCAILADDTLSCWGRITNGSMSSVSATDMGVHGVTSAAIGTAHVCATLTSGKVQCWMFDRGTHMSLPALDWDAKQVSMGNATTCVLLQDSKIYCWGSNSTGQLGDGTKAQKMMSVLVPAF